MDDDISPPYYVVTVENHSAWVVAASLIFLIYSFMGMIGKMVLRIKLTLLEPPDICLVVSLFVLVVETALIVTACKNGLGQHTVVLDSYSFNKFSKYYYAASILAVVVQALTKMSICLWISIISPQARVKLANRILMGAVIAWTISGIFAVAFACGLPHPWRSSGNSICKSHEAILLYNGVLNIITDIAISILPVVMLWNIQLQFRKKAAVCALFASRILVPAFSIPALATGGAYRDNLLTDPTWYAVMPTILGQISLNMSVLTACIPGLKSILENLLAGGMHATIQGGYDLTTSGNKKSPFTMTPLATSNQTSKGQGSNSRSRTNMSSKIAQRFRNDESRSKEFDDHDHETARSYDRVSSESKRNLTQGVILRTDQYEVTSVRRHSSSPHPSFGARVSGEDPDEIAHANTRV